MRNIEDLYRKPTPTDMLLEKIKQDCLDGRLVYKASTGHSKKPKWTILIDFLFVDLKKDSFIWKTLKYLPILGIGTLVLWSMSLIGFSFLIPSGGPC